MNLVFSIKNENERYKVIFPKNNDLIPEVSIYIYKDKIKNELVEDTRCIVSLLERAGKFIDHQIKLGVERPQSNIQNKKLTAELAAMVADEIMRIENNQGE